MSLWTLMDAAARATALLGVAAVVAVLLRHRSAALRHLVWATGLGGALVLPLAGLLVPPVPVPIPRLLADALPALAPGADAAESGSVPPTGVAPGLDPSGTAGGPGERSSIARTDPITEDGTAAGPAAGPGAAAGASSGRPEAAAPVPAAARAPVAAGSTLLVLWGLGAAAVGAWLLTGAWSMRRLARDATPVTSPDWTDSLREAREGLGVLRPVRLLRSDRAVMPMTWGWRRPVVLVPAAAFAWSPERRAVVLRHELAHAKRGDAVTRLLAHWTCAVYWFNPMVWFAAHRLRTEGERACDDAVLRSGTRPSDYANHLLDIARDHHAPRLGASAAVAMARPSQLEGRMRAILDPTISRGSRRSSGVVTGALLAAAVLAVSAAAPVAQNRAAPPAPGPANGQSAAPVQVGNAAPGPANGQSAAPVQVGNAAPGPANGQNAAPVQVGNAAPGPALQAPGAGQPSSPTGIFVTGTVSVAGRAPGAGQPSSPIRPAIVLEFTLPSGHRPQTRGPEGELMRIWLRDAGRLGFVSRIRDDAQQAVTVTVFDLDTTPHRELGAIDVAVGGDPVAFRTSRGPLEIAVPRIVVFDPAAAAAREARERAVAARAWMAVAEDILRTVEPERALAQERTRAVLRELQVSVAAIADRLTDETADDLAQQFADLQERLAELQERLAELQLLPDR